jgi:hypothetical protein
MTKQQGIALMSVGVAGYAIFRATQRVENAAEDIKHRGWRSEVVIAVLVAVAAAVVAVKKSSDAMTKVRTALAVRHEVE